MSTTNDGRLYGGKTKEERSAERREKLLEAGLELFGTQGFSATSIDNICTETRLNARYFYEEFKTKEALLLAVYDRHVEVVFGAVLAALEDAPSDPLIRLETGLSVFIAQALLDQRAARINYFEMLGVSPEVEARRREVMRTYEGVVSAQLHEVLGPDSAADPNRMRLMAVALVAATDGLIIDLLTDPDRGSPSMTDREDILATLTRVFAGIATL